MKNKLDLIKTENSQGNNIKFSSIYKYYTETMLLSALIWIAIAYSYVFYSARIAKIGVVLCLMAVFLIRIINNNIKTENDFRSFNKNEQRKYRFILIFASILVGMGVAFPFITIINWYFQP